MSNECVGADNEAHPADTVVAQDKVAHKREQEAEGADSKAAVAHTVWPASHAARTARRHAQRKRNRASAPSIISSSTRSAESAPVPAVPPEAAVVAELATVPRGVIGEPTTGESGEPNGEPCGEPRSAEPEGRRRRPAAPAAAHRSQMRVFPAGERRRGAQRAQQTSPQDRQWCLRRDTLNARQQLMHAAASASGTHRTMAGAPSPKSSALSSGSSCAAWAAKSDANAWRAAGSPVSESRPLAISPSAAGCPCERSLRSASSSAKRTTVGTGRFGGAGEVAAWLEA
eukprot:scaffold62381_cov24-Tisochrysis_lutea.AAC.1